MQCTGDGVHDLRIHLDTRIEFAKRITENFAHDQGMPEDTTSHGQQDGVRVAVAFDEQPTYYDGGKLGEFSTCLRENALGQGIAGIGRGEDRGK